MEEKKKFKNQLFSRSGLSTEIANRLCVWIREEAKPAGSVLGTEADLAREYGVSRTVIREAIGQLRGLGIVESRQGRGLCVAAGDAISAMAKVLAPICGDRESWARLCNMRFVFEVGSIPLAVERITSHQIERMRKLADEMYGVFVKKKPISREMEKKIAQYEIEFHQIIFDAAGCKFTEQIHALLVQYFFESSADGLHRSLPTLKDLEGHRNLVKAMEKRDAGKSVTIMVDHIRHILPDEL
ncbi:MAG: FadR family transcriptional regulator [Candidatus Omnitrophica bacterium]|nr:FadR family transcriptional regulator [Candidatus Omnitrophota bacterium]